jgi:hypothetical protein
MGREWNVTLRVEQISELLKLNQEDVQWLADTGLLKTITIGGRDFADARDVADMGGTL